MYTKVGGPVKCSKKPGTVRANYCTVMNEGVSVWLEAR